ncbi:hypothetical protein KR044_004125 [Drosophila immigrans]|nr:hypothetical protein KR044_004125 [Drosophila immigrans]
MKFIGLGLLYLLCAVAWADEPQPSEEVDEELDYSDNSGNFSDPLPILFSYVDDPYVLSITKKLNWFEATQACAKRGYTLAAVNSYSVQTLIYNFLVGSGLKSQLTEPVWTAGSNLANGAVWSWYSTGKAFSYRNFQNQNVGTASRCLAYNAITGYWNAELCTAKRYFICQCG